MEFDEYLAQIPQLHTWDGGKTWNSGGFEASQLKELHEFLSTRLPHRPVTLETGAGNSTITICFLDPARHTVICPDGGVLERIRSFLAQAGISSTFLDIKQNLSEWVLPDIARSTREGEPLLDFALIDGGHNWPTVFVDFFYVNFMLSNGGYLMIDDVQLHSVKELGRFLSQDPRFSLSLDMGKSLVFQKQSTDRYIGEWNTSPYILQMTEKYAQQANPFAL